jgi:hypothetical protein
MGFFEIAYIELVFLQKVIQIGSMFSSEFCCPSYVSLAGLKKINQVTLLEGIPRCPERPQRLLRHNAFCPEDEVVRNEILLGHGHGVFDGIFQLSYIPRPVVEHQLLHGLWSQALYFFSHLLAEFLYEMVHESRDIFLPFSQGRKLDRNDVNAIEEILPEQLLLDSLLQILISCHDQPNVHLQGSLTA